MLHRDEITAPAGASRAGQGDRHAPSRRALLALLVSAVLALSVAPAAHAGDTDGAEAFVRTKQGRLRELLSKKAPQPQVDAVFDEMLDYDRLARDSLDQHWEGRSEEERREFQAVLTKLVRRSYRRDLEKTLTYEVTFEGVTNGSRGPVVTTVAKNTRKKREEPYTIAYVLVRDAGEWRVRDIVTEAESLVFNYRRQFDRIIKRKGFAELLAKMKAKLDE